MIIPQNKSIILAADVVSLDDLMDLVESVCDIPGIGSIKLGFSVMGFGLQTAVNEVKDIMGRDFPVIYDHQKAGNDIPDTGKQFAKVLAHAGVDAAILFPFTGPETQNAWTRSCQEAGLKVITGGIMTHAKFLASEGGYINDDAVEKIYRNACCLGVRDFVVPGNKINWVEFIRQILDEEVGEDSYVLYAPGFITQGGDISECGKIAGKKWHPIVGSAIYGKKTYEERRQAAIEVTKQIIATE